MTRRWAGSWRHCSLASPSSTTTSAETDRLREQGALVELELSESRVEELDLEGALNYAERAMVEADRLWNSARLPERRALQGVLFPQGVAWNGADFGTPATLSLYRYLQPEPGDDEMMVGLQVAGWNTLLAELVALEAVGRAAGVGLEAGPANAVGGRAP